MQYSFSDIAFIGPPVTPTNVLKFYRMGIFPWESDPVSTWWAPKKRFILRPDTFYISRSLRKFIKNSLDYFQIKYDTDFSSVIRMCSATRKTTWITEDFVKTYTYLHKIGYAHSVEVYYNQKLVGGLYGVSLGKVFFGESMFHLMDNTSKLALVNLVFNLRRLGFILIDCQVYSKTFESFGAFFIEKKEFERIMKINNEFETIRGRWKYPQFIEGILKIEMT